MDKAVQARLQLLRTEFEAGQQRLAELEAQHTQVAETMLRISGAIQVLEELTGERPIADAPEENSKPPAPRTKTNAR